MNALEIVHEYLNTWNETDGVRRRAAVAALFTEDCSYTDPLVSVKGHAALDALIAGAQQQLPGLRFSLAGTVDSHHDQVRFTWHAAPEGVAEPIVIGFDVMLLDAGRVQNVYGFLDKLPS